MEDITDEITDLENDPFYSAPVSGRFGVMDVGLDGVANLVNLNVGDQYVTKGLELLRAILEIATTTDISDIQIRNDRYIHIATSEGLERLPQFGRMDTSDVVGVLLALAYNRESGIAVSRELQELELQSLSKALTQKRKVDFACEGGVAALLNHGDGVYALASGRLRVQAHFSATGLGVTVRILNEAIMSLEDTGLPPDVISAITGFVAKKSGLGLVTGATGSGKTTTLAALVEYIRRTMKKHIVTIEDPIEYHYSDTLVINNREVFADALITQQEVGRDVKSFQQGLNDALRKKPDIILLGEIRDASTMATCIEAAQTGHLVLSTLHTRGAIKTLSRIAEFFPESQQGGLMSSLADTLLFICSQGLLTPTSGKTRHLACEFFQNINTASKSAIRGYGTKLSASLEDIMASTENIKMEASLQRLRNARLISEETFRDASPDGSLTSR